jgi:hypothetical protein
MCIEVLVEDLRELGLAMGCVQFSRGAREVTVFCTLAASHAADDAEKQRVLDSTGLAAIRARLRDTLESHHPCLGLSPMSIQLPKHATQVERRSGRGGFFTRVLTCSPANSTRCLCIRATIVDRQPKDDAMVLSST